MIDTISLIIPEKDFTIIDHNRFSPCTENLFKYPYIKVNGKSPFKSVNNPSKKDIELYGYLPRLTLIKALRRGGFNIVLKLEFSIPKLLYGNNFDEVQESDFGEICWKLKRLLNHMGVEIKNVELISRANVSTIHYCKNIILTDYSSPYTYIQEVRKININRLLDMNQTDFRNEGSSFKFRSNDFEVIFYDKLADLRQAKISEKRTIEKDNYIQLNMFDVNKPIIPFEVLRIEVRIGSRRKMKQLLNKYRSDKKQTFNDLFSRKLSQEILLAVVEEIENIYPKILKSTSKTYEEFLIELQFNNPKLTFSQLLKFLGARVIIDEKGVRAFRKITQRFGDK